MTMPKSVRIDPLAVQQQALTTTSRPRAAGVGKSFGDIMGVAGAFAPLAGELTYQATGSPNAAAVLHSAFTAVPAAFGGGRYGGYGPGLAGDLPGVMGAPRYGSGINDYGSGDASGNVPGTDVPQAELIDQMNTNNLQLLELQAMMQNNMQQWTTKSNIMKSVHEAKMAMIQKFTVQG